MVCVTELGSPHAAKSGKGIIITPSSADREGSPIVWANGTGTHLCTLGGLLGLRTELAEMRVPRRALHRQQGAGEVPQAGRGSHTGVRERRPGPVPVWAFAGVF